ncbi:hypothetical protein HDU67_001607 [Dinochytrium kinnereticum]|nr:hypothetical protein HDU67_001607 [Dinochytrium kinnereticum]
MADSQPPLITGQEFDRWLLTLCDEERQIRTSKAILGDRRLFPTQNQSHQFIISSVLEPRYQLVKEKLSQIQVLLRNPSPIVSEAIWTLLVIVVHAQTPEIRKSSSFDARIRLVITSKLPEKALLIADNGFHTGDSGPRRAAFHFLAAFATVDPTALIMGNNRVTPLLIREVTFTADRVVQGWSLFTLLTLSKQGPLRDFLVGAGLLPELKRFFCDGPLEVSSISLEDVKLHVQIVHDITCNGIGTLKNIAASANDDLRVELSSNGFIDLMLSIAVGVHSQRVGRREIMKAIQTYATLTSIERKDPSKALQDITLLIDCLNHSQSTPDLEAAISKAVRNTLVHFPGEYMLSCHGTLKSMIPFLCKQIEELPLDDAEDAFAILREFSRGPVEKEHETREAISRGIGPRLTEHTKSKGPELNLKELKTHSQIRKSMVPKDAAPPLKKCDDPRWTVFQSFFSYIQKILSSWKACPAPVLHHILSLICNISTNDKLAQLLACNETIMTLLVDLVKRLGVSSAEMDMEDALQTVSLECIRNLCIDDKSCKMLMRLGGNIILRLLLTSAPGSENHTISLAVLRNLILQNDTCFKTLILCNNDLPNSLCANLISEVVSGLSSTDTCGVQRYSLDILFMTLMQGGEKLRQILLEESCLQALVVLMDTCENTMNAEIATRCYRILQNGSDDEDPWIKIMKEWEQLDKDAEQETGPLSTVKVKGKKRMRKTKGRTTADIRVR